MKVIKFLLAVALLPMIWAFSISLWELILIVWQGDLDWLTAAVFLSGFIISIVFFFTLPRPTRWYVFGHEATHAVAIWLSGGKVSRFHVGDDGGHVVTDRVSTWIALSPYMVPFYPLLVGLGWWVTLLFWQPTAVIQAVFLFLWAMVWSFHYCFTLSLIQTTQPDFAGQGYFFSWVVILLSQLFLLLAALWLAFDPMPLWTLLRLTWEHLIAAYLNASFLLAKGWDAIAQSFRPARP
ncbi:MAG: hypothetical protein ACFCUX_06190 [Candidatus Methylacidiphilales bacterium]